MPLERDDLSRLIDRTLRAIGRFLRRWWAALLAVAVALYILVQWVPAVARSSWRPGVVSVAIFQVIAIAVILAVLFAGLLWYLARPRVYWTLPADASASFAGYKGAPEVLHVARRIVTLLRGVRFFQEMSGQISRGLLLVGPPGAGKAYLAQCVSAEAGVPYGYVSAASLRALGIGLDALVIRRLYRKARVFARAYGGCVVFIDELDTLGGARGGAGLNELLLRMDPPPVSGGWLRNALRGAGLSAGHHTLAPVLTIGATTSPDALDPVLLRPGRFDRRILIAPPTDAHRGEVIDYYLNTARHDDIPLPRLVSDMAGYTPAAIKRVINEAIVIAHFDGRETITYDDIASARETHEYGARYPRTLSLLEKRRLAYHEAGHAIAQASLLPRFHVAHATIIKRPDSSGDAFVEAQPLEDIVTQSAEEVYARIQVALASRAAEEMFLHTRLNSAGGDLASATQLALSYLAHWGMDGALFSAAATLAPERMYTDPVLRERAETLLQQAFGDVRALLERRRRALIAIAEALLERGELDGDELQRIMRRAEHPTPPPVATASEVAPSVLAQMPSFAPPALLGAPATPPPASVDAIPAPVSDPGASEADTANESNESNGANETNGHASEPAAEAMPVSFTASPSQYLRGDRVIDRALLRGPRLTRPIHENGAPSSAADEDGE